MKNKQASLLLCLTLFYSMQLLAQDFIPGQSYFGKNNYTEYRAGNLGLIISVPHGGELKPDEIPNRSCAACVTVNDAYTQDLGNELYQAIKDLTGCYPHLIINKLHRSKMDANRDISEAALGNQQAEEAWMDFQQFIDTAKFQVNQQFQKGLFLDLHGHAHEAQRIEWGYLLSRIELQYSDDQLDQAGLADQTSFKSLLESNKQKLSLSELIRGDASLGSLMAEKGFAGVPSKQDPYPNEGEGYFSGGYNTRRHGSFEKGTIDGVQVECNQDIRFNDRVRQTFATRFAEVLITFLGLHYFEGELNASCLYSTTTKDEKQPSLFVYPNPTQRDVTIYGEPFPDRSRLFDLTGREVKSWENMQSEKLDLFFLEKGLYILMMYKEGVLIGRLKIAVGF